MKKAFLPFLFLGASTFLFPYDRGGFTFYFNNDFLYQRNSLAEESDQFYEAFSFFGKYGNWSGGATMRTFNFLKQDPNTTRETDFELQRQFIRYSSKNFNIQAGDFYSLLGRGMTLSVLQNDKALRDRTIFGGDARFQSEKVTLRVLGGTVEDELQSRKWRVAGAEGEVNVYRSNRVGAHFSYITDVDTFYGRGPRTTFSVSAAGDKLFDLLSYYAEVSRLKFENEWDPAGSGIYTNIGVARKNVSVMVEYKRYKDFDNELNNPPPADRDDEVTNLYDAESGRVYVQYSFFNPDLVLFLSAGRVREFDISGNHFYGGFTVEDLWEKVTASLTIGRKELDFPIKRVDGDFIYSLTDALSVEFQVKDKWYETPYSRFDERDFMTQFACSPYGAVFFQYQYSARVINDRQNFYNGGVRVNVWEGSYIEASGGSLRGGEVCAGGQCFYMPPFEGFKLALYTTFK